MPTKSSTIRCYVSRCSVISRAALPLGNTSSCETAEHAPKSNRTHLKSLVPSRLSQGSILAPTLFTLWSADLVEGLKQVCHHRRPLHVGVVPLGDQATGRPERNTPKLTYSLDKQHLEEEGSHDRTLDLRGPRVFDCRARAGPPRLAATPGRRFREEPGASLPLRRMRQRSQSHVGALSRAQVVAPRSLRRPETIRHQPPS